MTAYWILILVISGMGALVLELFLPGGIIGAIGLLFMGVALYLAYAAYGMDGLAYTLLAEIGIIGIGIYLWARYFPKSSLGRRLSIHEVVEDEDFRHRLDMLKGKTGEVVARCRPSGIVEIEGKRYDVVSEGNLLEPGTKVTVIKVEGTRVVVRPVPSTETTTPTP